MLIEHPRTNINFRNFNGEAPLTISVNNNLEVLVDLLINNERFDPEENCITEKLKSISLMNEILNFDRNHFKVIDFKKLLLTGESFLTLIGSQQFIDSQFISIVINSFYTAEIASFLLDHGVDPNIPDKNGFYPLEYAITLDSIDFICVLINTNKIDFTQIVETKSNLIRICDQQLEGSLKLSSAKKKTYLHIAARSKKTLEKARK